MLMPKACARLRARAAGDKFIDAVPMETFRELGKTLTEMGVKAALIKAGHRGGFIRTADVAQLNAQTALALPEENWRDRELWVPAFRADPAKVKTTTGAGDAAVAGFLCAILRGQTVERAGKYAMLAGRDSLYGTDTTSGLTRWGRMTRTLNRI